MSRPRARVSFESRDFMKMINLMPPALPLTTTIWAVCLALEYNEHAREDGFSSGRIHRWASLG